MINYSYQRIFKTAPLYFKVGGHSATAKPFITLKYITGCRLHVFVIQNIKTGSTPASPLQSPCGTRTANESEKPAQRLKLQKQKSRVPGSICASSFKPHITSSPAPWLLKK